MIEGALHHNTDTEVEKNYVDSHGQSDVAFAFCRLLGFELLPRFKGIYKKRLYRPEAGALDEYPNLQLVLSRPIDWELIGQQRYFCARTCGSRSCGVRSTKGSTSSRTGTAPTGSFTTATPANSQPTTARSREAEMLCLHLVQMCLVYINTLMIQTVLADSGWMARMTAEDFRGLTPLVYGHVTPYGSFHLDMSRRLQIDGAESAAPTPAAVVDADLL